MSAREHTYCRPAHLASVDPRKIDRLNMTNPILDARRALRLAITEIETACWSLERYGVQMDPEHTVRGRVLTACKHLYSIDWKALHELYIEQTTLGRPQP